MENTEQILRQLLDEVAAEQGLRSFNVIIEPVSSGGANYTSQLYVVTITGDKELRLFAKVATIGIAMRESVPVNSFKTERLFYTKIAKVYRDIEEKYKLPLDQRLSFPKFYGCNPNFLEETVVLENLVHQGFGDINRFVSIDWPYAASAVEEMAKLHALSHAYKRQNPEKFEEDVKKLKLDWANSNEQQEIFWNKGKNHVLEVTNEENKERVEKYLENTSFAFYEEFCAPIDIVVLIHGDYRVSNLMHKYNDDGSVKIKIVDLQTIQGGCSATDLVFFIVTSTDEKFRRQHFQRLLDHYYEQLSAALGRLGINPDDVYPRKVYDREFKMKLKYTLNLATFVLPVVTVDVENAPVLTKDDGIAGLAVGKTSQVFHERMNGIINDCILWGIL